VHATPHRALKDAVRWERNPADAADPPRFCGDASREMKTRDARQLAGPQCAAR